MEVLTVVYAAPKMVLAPRRVSTEDCWGERVLDRSTTGADPDNGTDAFADLSVSSSTQRASPTEPHRLAKVRVAGANPVLRSRGLPGSDPLSSARAIRAT